jgi:hypothetical protein
MSVAIATGWPPAVVRALSLAELEAIAGIMADRDRAIRRKRARGSCGR